MVRRSTFLNRVCLSVTQLETREVPAGMIEMSFLFDDLSQNIELRGDNQNNHIRVDMPNQTQVIISSESGPIHYYDDWGEHTKRQHYRTR